MIVTTKIESNRKITTFEQNIIKLTIEYTDEGKVQVSIEEPDKILKVINIEKGTKYVLTAAPLVIFDDEAENKIEVIE